ncbi:MAG: response regulator transcription factor [Ginsengibacter sp.]
MPRIVMIDDEEDLLTVTKNLLCKKGFEVSCFTDWEKAEESISVNPPNLILLDVFLSGVDGLEVCKRLRASHATRHIPIIILSGYPKVAGTAIYEFGADEFISKPFEEEDLIQKIHKVLSRRHQSV